MGWFSNMIEKFKDSGKEKVLADSLDAQSPVFSGQRYNDMAGYLSEFGYTPDKWENPPASVADLYDGIFKQTIRCIVQEMVKLRPMHVIDQNGDSMPAGRNDNIQSVLDHPNPYMTKADFLEKTMWLLLLNYNAFIVPVYSEWTDNASGAVRRTYKALYPIKPTEVTMLQDDTDSLFVKFDFANSYSCVVPYEDVIHVRYEYFQNEFLGGNEVGSTDRRMLQEDLKKNRELMQSISKSLNASYAINGIVKYNGLLDKGKTELAMKEFEEKLKSNKSGFLPLGLDAQYIPITTKAKVVDPDVLRFMDEKILRYFGVSVPILTGEYNKEQYEAFYQKTLEGYVIRLGQAFTKAIFSQRQLSFGHKIEFYPEDLVFMTMEQKLELVNLLAPTGGIFENEKRRIFGLQPLPELVGKRFQSLNWVDADHAAEYQIGQEDENDEENNQTGEE